MKLVVNNGSKIGRNDPCPCGSGAKYKKCCWKSDMAKKLDEALESDETPQVSGSDSFRLEMEAMMGQIERIIQEKGLSPEEATQYFMNRSMDEIAAESRNFKNSPQAEAQDLALQAYSAKTARQGLALAQKALDLDPNCAEAMIVIDSIMSEVPVETIEAMEKASEAAKKTLGEKFFKENEGNFWGLLETRSYMRAQQNLAEALWECRRQSEAIEVCWNLLRLNPNDNQGIRYILFDYLLTDNRLEDIEKLLKNYPKEETAHWQYSKSLYYFKKYGAESEKAIQQLKSAYLTNPHIHKYFNGKLKLPVDTPTYFSPGSKEEAICYIEDSIAAWLGTPQAIHWMAAAQLTGEKKSQKKRSKKKKDHETPDV